MKFALINECAVTAGMAYHTRYHESLKEIQWAEEMGFDVVGTSEQHFVASGYTVSAPEVFLGAVAALTSTIKIRPMSIVMLKYNHPIRIAERLATIDILSKGRLEIGTARSNNIEYMNAFGVDASQTRSEWRETLEVTVRSLVETPMEFHGEHYDFAPLNVIPKMYQSQCPPLYVSATSAQTHTRAGEMGIGAMTFENWFGWEYLAECISAYQDGLTRAQPVDDLWQVTRAQSLLTFPAHCAATREQAMAESRSTVLGLFNAVSHMYTSLAAQGGGEYAYLDRIKDLDSHKFDMQYLMDSSPALVVGTPDDVIERLKRLETMGIDEVILKIDGYGHAVTMRSIEMFGKYVIPEFRNPRAIPKNDWEAMGVEGVERFQL